MQSPKLTQLIFEQTPPEAKDPAKTIKLAAGIMFQAKDTGRILMLKRSSDSPKPNTWALAGGKIDTPEEEADPKIAARREAWEEIGYKNPNLDLKLVYVSKRPGFRFYNYVATVPTEFGVTLNSEHTDAKWFSPSNFPSPIHPGVAEMFAAIHLV